MGATAVPVAAVVMGGVFLTVVAWKVLDLAMHAMSLDRDDDDPDAVPARGRREREARR